MIWFSNYCLACIIVSLRQQTKYFILSSSETHELNLLKPFSDPHPLVSRFCDILELIDPNMEEAEYLVQFLSCQTTLTKSEKQKIQRKHKSMDPIKKEALCNKNAMKYKSMHPSEKKAVLEKRAISYKEMGTSEKEACLKRNRSNMKRNYHAMTHSDKKELLQKQVMKRKPLNPSQKEAVLKKRVISYKEMDTSEKEVCLERKRSNLRRKYHKINSPQKQKKQEAYKKSKSTIYNLDYFISNFHNKIREGPCYICSVCNRLLYKKSVKLLNRNSCSSSLQKSVFTNITSVDNKEYICSTCHSKVAKGKILCQAVYNDMYVDEIPVELALLEKLEQILIAQRIVFEKIIIMPKGQQKKVSGAICNVPVDCDQTCKVLPRPPERSGIIMLKLKTQA